MVSYNPCPTDGMPCRVMPFGDSITQGFPTQAMGGYRSQLFHDAVADKKKLTFVGTLQDGPASVDGVPFPKNHEGHFAWSLGMLMGLIPDTLNKVDKPHIILVHAGTNNRDGAVNDAVMQLSMLVDKLIAWAPQAAIAVAQIIPVGNNAQEDAFVKSFNAMIPVMVQARASAGKNVFVVDQWTGFDPSPTGPDFQGTGGLHPGIDGYKRMGDVWYAAIKTLLP